MDTQEIQTYLSRLQNTLDELVTLFNQSVDFSTKVNTSWSAKDVLGHLTFWHESFAKNVSDITQEIKPTPLKGKLSEVNSRSVESTKNNSIEELTQRILEAQQTINTHILSENIHMIPYKKGSRDYAPIEHLDIVEKHIKKHLSSIKKKYNQ